MGIKFGRISKEREQEIREQELTEIRTEIAENFISAEAAIAARKKQILNEVKKSLSKGINVKITEEMNELKLTDEIVQLKVNAEFALRVSKEFLGEEGDDVIDLDTPSSWLDY